MSIEQQQVERQQVDIRRALHVAIFAVDNFVMDERSSLDCLSGAARTRLIVEAALAYLVGNELVTVTPDEQWPDFMPMQVPTELKPDVAGEARRARDIAGRLP